MYIKKVKVRNFRLLQNIELCLAKKTTVIVGRNNSGKTSLAEIFLKLMGRETPQFGLEDFSLNVNELFWDSYKLYNTTGDENKALDVLPYIEILLTIEYEKDIEVFGPLSKFIINFRQDCTTAIIKITFSLEKELLQSFFNNLADDKGAFFNEMKNRVIKYYKTKVEAEDPDDEKNCVAREWVNLRSVLQCGFITAQRTLDETSRTGPAPLGRILETLLTSASQESAHPKDKEIAEQLKLAVKEIEKNINNEFNNHLQNLFPTFEMFGYPGLSDPQLRTETELKVEQLLTNNTKLGYIGLNNINLPESYNGLGPRNLIYILLKIYEFFSSYATTIPISNVQIIFIEEPEAHLHPQMQNVFIRKLTEIAIIFSQKFNNGNQWPIQFIVTTHSSHIANEAPFDTWRYFYAHPCEEFPNICTTKIKDLQSEYEIKDKSKGFLQKYMTLTKCDLLFADFAILIEGASERILLPKMIEKLDKHLPKQKRLANKYLSVVEVGGAYAHIFFKLLDFLELRTLIITDIDSINIEDERKKSKVSEGTNTSNACINTWFANDTGDPPTIQELLEKNETDKIKNCQRIAYQIPHTDGDSCGRSFEGAFILANPMLFGINIDDTCNEKEDIVWKLSNNIEKTDFALKYAIEELNWITPRYIEEGLRWLTDISNDSDTTQSNEQEVSVHGN